MKPVVLCILDGWGFSKQKLGNAIVNAQTSNIDFIKSNYPSVLLQASGQAVGLSWGESGNSEVGHLTLGSGRIIFQYLSRIHRAIENGNFFTNPKLLEAVEHARTNHSRLHLIGLLTSSSVHAHLDHILALIDLAKRNGLTDVYLHLFTDGKDSSQKEAPFIYKKVADFMKAAGVGKLATIIGRDIAMDRNNNWDLTKQTYDLLTKGQGQDSNDTYKTLEEKYNEGFTDINMPAIVADPDGTIRNDDAIIFFNFREDRMKQITEAFTSANFDKFEINNISNLLIACMTQYIENAGLNVAFPPSEIKNCLAETISKVGLKQLHIAETEKYAHVTFFFNALKQTPFDDEDDVLIKSERDATADPAMKAREVLAETIDRINKNAYDFILVNFANADMLAHMGNFENVVKGIEILDIEIGKLREAILAKDGYLIITSDHGNAESLTYRGTGTPETRHNPNPVPLYFVTKEAERTRTEEEIKYSTDQAQGFLSDVAPTILELLQIAKPSEMTGNSLLDHLKK